MVAKETWQFLFSEWNEMGGFRHLVQRWLVPCDANELDELCPWWRILNTTACNTTLTDFYSFIWSFCVQLSYLNSSPFCLIVHLGIIQFGCVCKIHHHLSFFTLIFTAWLPFNQVVSNLSATTDPMFHVEAWGRFPKERDRLYKLIADSKVVTVST